MKKIEILKKRLCYKKEKRDQDLVMEVELTEKIWTKWREDDKNPDEEQEEIDSDLVDMVKEEEGDDVRKKVEHYERSQEEINGMNDAEDNELVRNLLDFEEAALLEPPDLGLEGRELCLECAHYPCLCNLLYLEMKIKILDEAMNSAEQEDKEESEDDKESGSKKKKEEKEVANNSAEKGRNFKGVVGGDMLLLKIQRLFLIEIIPHDPPTIQKTKTL